MKKEDIVYIIIAIVTVTAMLLSRPAATAQEPEELVDSFIAPHPCELTTVICEHEDDRTIAQRITGAAQEYGIDPNTALRIGACESSLNPEAQNPQSSAKGLFQFTDSTWDWIGADGHQFDVDENIEQFMIWYPKYPTWWECV